MYLLTQMIILRYKNVASYFQLYSMIPFVLWMNRVSTQTYEVLLQTLTGTTTNTGTWIRRKSNPPQQGISNTIVRDLD